MILDKCESLLPNSNKKLLCICDECNVEFYRQFQLLNRQTKHRCFPCSRKHIGKTMNRTSIDKATKSRVGTNHPRWNPQFNEFKRYANKVHWLTQKVYKNNKSIINPQNLKRTLCGVPGGYQLDHKISVKEGFEKHLPAHEISNVNNLQMLPWKENRTKGA